MMLDEGETLTIKKKELLTKCSKKTSLKTIYMPIPFKKHLRREWEYLVFQCLTLTFKLLPKKKKNLPT